MEFTLHPRLSADTHLVADWALSRVLLMNDSRFPWLILVPRRAGLSELFDLDEVARALLTEEIARSGAGLKRWSGADKINVGALGNMVPQLHIHVVARMAGDAAWPGPVWGAGQNVPYSAGEMNRVISELRSIF